MKSARNHFVKRMEFKAPDLTCQYSRLCQKPATFQIGWTFDSKSKGDEVVTEKVLRKRACEHHGRMFAFKHGIPVPRSAA